MGIENIDILKEGDDQDESKPVRVPKEGKNA